MPSVTMTTTMPSVNSISASGGSQFNPNERSIKEIRDHVRKEIPLLLKGASPASSMAVARKLGEAALLSEDTGDEKLAFYSYQRVAQMLFTISEQQEFKANQQQLFPQFDSVFKWMKETITPRANKLEERLREMEVVEAQRMKENEADANGMTPLSVADRIKSLQANGLAVQTGALMASANAAKSRRPSNAPATTVNTTRSSRGSLSSHHGGLTSPMSPSYASTSTTREPVSPHSASSQTLFPSPPSPTQAPPTPQFVSLSSLGPPSPTSSAPPSPLPTPSDLPLLSKLVGAIGSSSPDFERAFPSLEEWEETLQNGPGQSSYESAADQEQGHMPRHDQFVPSSSFQRSPVSPQAYQSPLPSLARRFSILSIDRPASTPPRPLPVPDSPTNENAAIPESAAPLAPREIYNLQQRRKEVLFLDLRSREKWDVERVKGDVVCVEPTFATHDLTADRLVSLLELSSSRQERAMFENRRQFSLVVIYEEEEPSDVSRAVAKALWDMEFRREVKLKRAPVLMSGGFRRWKEDVGYAGVASVSHGRERLRARTSEISLKSSGTGTGSGSGHEGGSVSRQVTGQKISPTSTANGWALPATAKHGSISPGGSAAPSINGTPLPPPLQSRRPSPPRNDRLPTPSQPQPPNTMPSQGPSPSSYPEQQIDPSIRPEGPSPRPLPVPQPYPASSPAPMPGSSSSISRDQFWVPPPSSREQDEVSRLARKPALPRPPSSTHLPSSSFDHTYPLVPSSRHMSPPAPITYPTAPSRTLPPIQMPSPQHRPTPPQTHTHTPQPQLNGVVSPLPQASIRPLPLSRRRSDYLDQPSQPQPVPPSYSSANGRHSLDYPSYPGQTIRPPPPAAGERYPRMPNGTASYTSPPIPTSSRPNGVSLALKPTSSMPNGQIVPSDYPVMYWSDYQVSTSGLKNLGNTCYMNSTIQCLSSVYPFAIYFSDGRFKNAINRTNAMSSKGEVALAFASLLHQMRQGDMVYLTPHEFRKSICLYAPQFSGSDQHDAEEFLNFLLDGLHEDLNRVTYKSNKAPSPEREAELERMPQQKASESEWRIYRMSNNSIVVDYFQGQFRNRLQCLTCGKTSTTYNPFSDLSLPIPAGRGVSRVSLQQCLDAFVKEEIMEKSDAWHCPSCKTLRKASKQLSISRLPAVLIVVLKRFSFKGPFTDKLETLVDFPIKDLDLTNYLPPPLPPSDQEYGRSYAKSMDTLREDPSTQVPPYRYDLFGVTNHYGSLSSGHYTAFINARGGWQYCDDSRVTPADNREIVSKAAYVLYYKRSRP